MKKHLFLIISIALSIGSVYSQSITVDASLDSLQILIGEQTKLRLQVSSDADKQVAFPIFQDTLISGIEVLETSKLDTHQLNNGQRMLLTQEYTITSFDSALYYIPPMVVTVDGNSYPSKALALKVYSIPVDTLHPELFFGPKTVMKSPFVWKDWYLSIILGILFGPLMLLLWYLVKCFQSNEPIILKVKGEVKILPHVRAMNELEAIRQKKEWQKGAIKKYYTELTDVVRIYITDRYGFNAMEMTSSEIIGYLSEKIDNKDVLRNMGKTFQTADWVKFAKHVPLMNENDANYSSIVDFIAATKEEVQETDKPQPAEITVIEKRPLHIKIALGIGIVALAGILIAALIYICSDLYNYFS